MDNFSINNIVKLFVSLFLIAQFIFTRGVELMPFELSTGDGKLEPVPVGSSEYRIVEGRRLAPFQLCLACKCCAGTTCTTMPCCFGIDCQLPNKPYGVCAFVPNKCDCVSCAV